MEHRDTDIGHIVSIEGGIVDVRFPEGRLPSISSRLLTLSEPEISIEVASLPSSDTVRGLVLNPTADLRLGLSIAERIRSGTVQVNRGAANAYTPMGGVKQSGIGRERGVAGFREYQEIKHIVLAPAGS